MPNQVITVGPHDRKLINTLKENDWAVVNATSLSEEPWSKGLSPFYLGPVSLYGGLVAKNMENAWQFSCVYREHMTADDKISQSYFTWAKNGWNSPRPVRYPLGKEKRPEFILWNGDRIDLIEARTSVYLHLYAKLVTQTLAYQKLQQLYEKKNVAIFCFDAYATNEYIPDVLSKYRTFGQGFLLLGLISGEFDSNGLITGLRRQKVDLPQFNNAFKTPGKLFQTFEISE